MLSLEDELSRHFLRSFIGPNRNRWQFRRNKRRAQREQKDFVYMDAGIDKAGIDDLSISFPFRFQINNHLHFPFE